MSPSPRLAAETIDIILSYIVSRPIYSGVVTFGKCLEIDFSGVFVVGVGLHNGSRPIVIIIVTLRPLGAQFRHLCLGL